jgi:hypothetical protein
MFHPNVVDLKDSTAAEHMFSFDADVVLHDNFDAADVQNLVGAITLTFTATGGQVTGSLDVGKARGAFHTTARDAPDGTYTLTGNFRAGAFSSSSETCDCKRD